MQPQPVPFCSVRGLSPLPASPFSPTGLSFDIMAGSLVVLMGASGSGKSRLLRALADLDPNEGSVTLEGQERASLPAPAWRKRLVYLGADSGWWSDNVGDHFSARPQAQAMLAPFGLPSDALDWSVSRLSTGEKQRLALIRTLTLPFAGDHGRLYLLDEPTSALDANATLAVEQVLRGLLSPRVAVLMITHSQHQAERIADRMMTLQDGILSERRPDE